MAELKAKNREIDELNRQIASAQTEAILENSKRWAAWLITALSAKPSSIRCAMADNARDKMPETVCILAGGTPEKMNFIVTCGKDAVAMGAHAGKIAKAVATITGAGGGGRPDSAMAGVGDRYKIDMALAQAEEIVSGVLKA
ncbi:MAG: DHHA1 domain-containing protein [Oscillospiraceae bacterium]